MLLVRNNRALNKIIRRQEARGKTIGFVPTMGYLHEGHLSLVRLAKKKSKFVVVSIFVNPTQFAPHEDLKKYPRDLKRDLNKLKAEGVDLVFYPSVKTMYPAGYKTYVTVRELSKVLCGISRPTHFEGVATVVLKLFNIVQPDIAVFGRKDYQQLVIIKRMVKDLNLGTKIIAGRIVREKDGLAMSSRNTYLSQKDRKNAAILYQALQWARKAFRDRISDPQKITKRMRRMIQGRGGRIDYIEVIDKDSLEPVRKLRKGDVIVLAVYFGETRLIDNIGVKS